MLLLFGQDKTTINPTVTSGKYEHFHKAESFSCRVWDLNNDKAKFVLGWFTGDSGIGTGSHGTTVLSTEHVRGLEDWSICQRVIVRQPDHKVVKMISYKMEKRLVERGQCLQYGVSIAWLRSMDVAYPMIILHVCQFVLDDTQLPNQFWEEQYQIYLPRRPKFYICTLLYIHSANIYYWLI